ncbi:hypothetical protein BO71DRAFT_445027 [Aspergillus ellipticus CBS 707.79]|uniref:Uncharacterized protein n=1 Tax=Aspergillus ellipticus CBS 707.79 TaxID=1448320 RepID=A0A319DCQ6_9EURO|nr:hypothetical protein BO71DRAFT_445027 [Aspergillus ellipticus CBS 707.79]
MHMGFPTEKQSRIKGLLSCTPSPSQSTVLYQAHLGWGKSAKLLNTSLIPLAILHYTSIKNQIRSSNPTLAGADATVIEELHLSISILLLTLSSAKLFLAAYEDEDGLAYMDESSRGRSQPRSKSRKKLTFSRQYDHMEDPILRGQSHSDLRIVKDVEIEVTSEAVELQDRGGMYRS